MVTSTATYSDVLSFNEYLLARGLNQKTVVDYAREITLVQAWFEERDLDLGDTIPSRIIEYADTRPNTPSVRAHLRSALKYWWAWRGVTSWSDAVAVPKTPTMTCKALDDDQAKRLLARAQEVGWRTGIAVEVMLSLALRNEETASMRWDAFDTRMEWYTVLGKGNRIRRLPVDPDLAGKLAPYRNGSPYVFEGRDRAHVSHQTICNWVKRIASEAGIDEEMWPHRLRHTALAVMNDATQDLRTVQAFAGHSRPDTTAGYTRTSSTRLRAASNALRERLASLPVDEPWQHAAHGDRPVTYVGTGDGYGTINAVCDLPGGDEERPFCWQGPDRETLEEAIADARAHASAVEPEILNTSWPDLSAAVNLTSPAIEEFIAPVIPLRRETDAIEAIESDHAGASAPEPDVGPEPDVISVEEEQQSDFDEEPTAAQTSQPDPPDPRPESLTPRELEVLRLLASGASTTDALACRLGITRKTVKNHMSSIFEKLGIHDRTQAVITAIRLGIVTAEVKG